MLRIFDTIPGPRDLSPSPPPRRRSRRHCQIFDVLNPPFVPARSDGRSTDPIPAQIPHRPSSRKFISDIRSSNVHDVHVITYGDNKVYDSILSRAREKIPELRGKECPPTCVTSREQRSISLPNCPQWRNGDVFENSVDNNSQKYQSVAFCHRQLFNLSVAIAYATERFHSISGISGSDRISRIFLVESPPFSHIISHSLCILSQIVETRMRNSRISREELKLFRETSTASAKFLTLARRRVK